MAKYKMTEHELGLALGQQLLGIQDQHFGLWDDELELNFDNLAIAQRRFANLIASELPDPAVNETHILDVGCGTGHILSLLTQKDYQVDAVSPSHFLIELVKQRLTELPDSTSKVFEAKFEDFPEQIYQQYYDVIFFNESLNHIPIARAFTKVQKLLKPGGLTIICDSFYPDSTKFINDKSIKHTLRDLYRYVDQSPFSLLRDDDITEYVAPTIELMEEFLKTKLKPASETLGQYLQTNNPVLAKIGAFLLKKKFSQLNEQYFTQYNKKALLNGSASYHFIVLQLVKPV
ncbi:MAG: class I SAM-dependent methyltransferase [Gammaproteobacteria bacterium]